MEVRGEGERHRVIEAGSENIPAGFQASNAGISVSVL